MPRTFYVYIMSNRRRTVLYTGMTNDLRRRLAEHELNRPGTFTARYRVTDIVHVELFEQPDEAIAREKQIKGWRREKKLTLILHANPGMIDLRRTLLKEE